MKWSLIFVIFCLCACSGSIIAIFVVNWRASVINAWAVSSQQTQKEIGLVISQHLSYLKFAANSVPTLIPTEPYTNYDPTEMMRLVTAFDQLTSAGIIRAAPNTTNGKLSWQLAYGFGCSDFIYAYSDEAINPAFLGFCANLTTVDYSVVTYNGLDWGLKADEAAIIDGRIKETFLPIFNLLSQFTLTYEQSAYGSGIVFAEIDLRHFSDYVANNVSGIAYIAETKTGAMIASTIPNSVINATLARQYASTSSFPAISQTWATPLPNSYHVVSSRYVEPGLDWTIMVVTPNSDLYWNLEFSIIVASVINMSVIIIAIAVIIVVSLCLRRKKKTTTTDDPLFIGLTE